MADRKTTPKYSEDFKKTIVSLYQSGKTYSEIQKEYGVSSSALSKWVHKYSQVQVDDDTVLTAQQIKALQRRNAQLEEENLILKKAIAIFTPPLCQAHDKKIFIFSCPHDPAFLIGILPPPVSVRRQKKHEVVPFLQAAYSQKLCCLFCNKTQSA